jgi:hypothetical protein
MQLVRRSTSRLKLDLETLVVTPSGTARFALVELSKGGARIGGGAQLKRDQTFCLGGAARKPSEVCSGAMTNTAASHLMSRCLWMVLVATRTFDDDLTHPRIRRQVRAAAKFVGGGVLI